MSKMYEQFKTDQSLEKKGINIDYGSFVVTIARAGGSNKRFSQMLTIKSRPHRRALQSESLDEEISNKILREVMIATVILNWQVRKEDESLEQGVESKDGEILPFNKENINETLKELPDLLLDLQQQAMNMTLFKETIQEEDLKNL